MGAVEADRRHTQAGARCDVLGEELGFPWIGEQIVVIGHGAMIAQGRHDDRGGFDYPLQRPEAAIPPDEDEVSIDAAMAMRAAFAQESPALRALFDALVALLTGGSNRH